MTSTTFLLGLPPKTFVGLDLLSFNSSPNFRGIAKLPPGTHFLYTGSDTALSLRHGTWFEIQDDDDDDSHKIFQWNANTENLEYLNDDGDATSDVFSNDARKGLIDYEALQTAASNLVQQQSEEQQTTEDQSQEDDGPGEMTDWPNLSSHVTSSTLTRILGKQWHVSSASSDPDSTEKIPGLSHLEASEALDQLPLNLCPINLKKTWEDGNMGRTRTDRARDRSWYLGHLTASIGVFQDKNESFGAKEMLGEIEFCFLMVLTLANYSCLEQWKRLWTVIFTCQQVIDELERFFVDAVKVLHLQIKHVEDVEGGLFDLRDEHASSWLRSLWAQFRAEVDRRDEGQVRALKAEVNVLQKLFEDKYGWQSEKDMLRRGMLELEDGEQVEVTLNGVDEDEETGEYAPVIVET
jgi:A1 cistron-splicing factor AAR2